MLLDIDVGRFSTVFRGRTDIWFDCVNDVRGGLIVGRSQSLSYHEWFSHLKGSTPIGVYNLLPDSTCWWSATDIDYDDMEAAYTLVKVWEYYGLVSFVERSRSKGWHVWLFHSEPIDAEVARSAWLWVHEVANVPAKEVYPKQTNGAETYGNCIRLPYANTRDPERQFLIHGISGEPLDWKPLCALLTHETDASGTLGPEPGVRATQANLEAIQAIATSPAPKHTVPHRSAPITRGGGDDQDIAKVYRGEVEVLSGTRDNTFWTLACYLVGRGFTDEESRDIITQVWETQTEQEGYSLSTALKKVDQARVRLAPKLAEKQLS